MIKMRLSSLNKNHGNVKTILTLLLLLAVTGCGKSPERKGSLLSLSFSPDKKHLIATGMFNGTSEIRLFEDTEKGELNLLTSFSSGAGAATWSHDGLRCFFIDSENNCLKIYNVNERKIIQGCDFKWPSGVIGHVTENTLVAAPILIADFEPRTDPPVLIRDCTQKNKSPITAFGGSDSGSIFSVSSSRLQEGLIAVSYLGGTPVEIWDYQKEEIVLRYQIPQLSDCWIKLSPDGRLLAALEPEGFTLWDVTEEKPKQFKIENEKLEREISFFDYFPCHHRLSFSENGKRLAICLGKSVIVIDAQTQETIFFHSVKQPGEVLMCAISPDGKTIAVPENNRTGIQLHKVKRP